MQSSERNFWGFFIDVKLCTGIKMFPAYGNKSFYL